MLFFQSKPVMSMDYIDEKSAKIVPPQQLKRKSLNSSTTYQQQPGKKSYYFYLKEIILFISKFTIELINFSFI